MVREPARSAGGGEQRRSTKKLALQPARLHLCGRPRRGRRQTTAQRDGERSLPGSREWASHTIAGSLQRSRLQVPPRLLLTLPTSSPDADPTDLATHVQRYAAGILSLHEGLRKRFASELAAKDVHVRQLEQHIAGLSEGVNDLRNFVAQKDERVRRARRTYSDSRKREWKGHRRHQRASAGPVR